MEAKILFPKINLFVSESIPISPEKISKSRGRRLKKKSMIRHLKKEAGSVGASSSSDWLPVPPPDHHYSIAPSLPEGIGVSDSFDDNGDVLVSIEGGATVSMVKVPIVDASRAEKKRNLSATSSSDLCRGGHLYCL